MKKIEIDLFSDTNCEPSPAMRQAMCQAEVGNEVAGEDPTVNRLLEAVCDLLGKECGLFMPSGTMCNGVAYRVWCCRAGDRIFFDQWAHAANMAAGLPSGLAQATAVNISCRQGIFSGAQLAAAIGPRQGYNIPRARVVSVEQTTNLGGGAIWPLSTLQEVHQVARQQSMVVHMDGARLFNAVVASGISAREFCQYADSVWVDFAKGLGAPMGAVLCGDKAFIEEAWYYKFQQGGTMHQVGILAAGCLYALEHQLTSLAQDHEHALLLAKSLATHPNIFINVEEVVTNIIIFQIKNTGLVADQLVQQLLVRGIRLLALEGNRLRAIVHRDISRDDIYLVSEAIMNTLEQQSHITVG